MRTHPCAGLPARRRLCAAVCALAAVGATTTAHAAVQPNPHGVVSAVNGSQLAGAPESTWGPQLAAMRRDGVQEVRSDAAWASIQPAPPTIDNPGFDWAHYDAWVSALASKGLTWQPILDYNTSWANAGLNPGAFAAYAAAVAGRYGANGTFWAQHPLTAYLPAQIFEVWNEENISPRYYMTPISYGKLYLAARSSIKAVDPSAAVDVGGLSESGSPRNASDSAAAYVALMLATNPSLKGAIDGIALHPYAPSASESEGWVVHFRHALTWMGVGPVPIDLTEFGWPYSLTTESWRAAQMGSLGDALPRSNCGVRLAAPYDWVNPGDPADEDFGLVDGAATSVAAITTSPSLRPAGAAWLHAFPRGSAEPMLTLC